MGLRCMSCCNECNDLERANFAPRVPLFYLPRNFAAAQACKEHYPLQQFLHSVSCRKFYSRNICQDPRRILPAAGELCVAKYSKDDKWYRARITSVREEELQVCFKLGTH